MYGVYMILMFVYFVIFINDWNCMVLI